MSELTSDASVDRYHDRTGPDVLCVTIIGGGPVGLALATMLGSALPKDRLRVRIFEHRWYRRQGRIEWKDGSHANQRRRQVTTIQSRQYTALPSAAFAHVFRPGLVRQVWLVVSDAVDGLPPLNIAISDVRGRPAELGPVDGSGRAAPRKFELDRDRVLLRGEHLVVVCGGARSSTRDSLDTFGRADADAFTRGGRPLRDIALGIWVRSGLPSATGVVWTVAQNRFLLNQEPRVRDC